MRTAISVLGIFILSAVPALSEPYYLVRTLNDGKNAFLVDAGSITPKADKVYHFTLMNVFNGDGIKDGAKSRVSTLEVNCTASTFSIVRLETFDASGTSLIQADGSLAAEPISSGTVIKSIADFVCSGANPDAGVKVARIPDGQSPIAVVDEAYGKVSAQ